MKRIVVVGLVALACVLASAAPAFAPVSPTLLFVRGGDIWWGPPSIPGFAFQTTDTPNTMERSPSWVPSSTPDAWIYSAQATPAPAATWQLWRGNGAVADQMTSMAGPADANGVGIASPSGDGSKIAFDFRDVVSSSMWWQTPQLYRMANTPMSATTQFFPPADGVPAAQPAWWPAGDRLAVSMEDIGDDFNNIWIISATGGVSAKLTSASLPGQRWIRPAFSPSGEWLTASYIDARTTGRGYLYKMRFDGTNKVRLTDPGAGLYDQASTWSDDGSFIVFERYDPAAGGSDLYSIPSTATPAVVPSHLETDGAEPSLFKKAVVFKPAVGVSPVIGTYSPRLHGARFVVTPTLAGGPAGAMLRIWRKPRGLSWVQGPLVAGGTHVVFLIDRNSSFYAAWSGSDTASACMSLSRGVLVRPYVSAVYSRLRIPADRQIGVVGRVLPVHNRGWVWLQKRMGGVWRTIMRTRTSSASSYFFIFEPRRSGRHVLRVYVPADANHAAAATPAVTIWAF